MSDSDAITLSAADDIPKPESTLIVNTILLLTSLIFCACTFHACLHVQFKFCTLICIICV